MTSWEIIRDFLVKGRPGSVGAAYDLVVAVDLFHALEGQLIDKEAARAVLEAEPGILGAILSAPEPGRPG